MTHDIFGHSCFTQLYRIYFLIFVADATDKELVDLVQELEVMKRFGQHDNIINLLGCMTRDGPLYVIVEYARHGNLRDFLRNHRPKYSYGSVILNNPAYDDLQLTQRHLVSFASQIADGMMYLSTNQVIHILLFRFSLLFILLYLHQIQCMIVSP